MKRFKNFITLLVFLLPALSQAATYTLPADFGSGPFANCIDTASIYSCSSSLSLANNTVIEITKPIALAISGSLVIGKNVQVNLVNSDLFALSATGNISVDKNSNLFANLTADGNITVGKNITITGDLRANLLAIGSGTAVAGTCLPDNVACTATGRLLPLGGTCEYFDAAALPADWSASSVDRTGVSNQTSSSGNSLYLRSGEATVDSPDFNLSLQAEVTLSAWVRRGQDLFSEDPDTGEDLAIQYKDASGLWIELISYQGNGTNGQIYTPTFSLTGAQLHTNFAVRFWKKTGSIGDYDYWHIDDVCLTTVGLPTPVIAYRFDENSWNGTANEVSDSSGSDLHATSDLGSATTTSNDAVMCRSADFTGGDKFITATDLSALRTTASLSFWIKTTQTGAANASSSPGLTGIQESGGTDDIFWGWLNPSGGIGITVGNDNSAVSSIAITDNVFHHLVLTRNATTDTYQIFIDGQDRGTGSYTNSGLKDTISNIFNDIGRVEDTAGSPVYLDALIDEFMVFDSVLNGAQAEQIFNLQSAGNNLDGSARNCSLPPTPSICFTDDFNRASLGTDWAVTSRGTDASLPRIINNRLSITQDINNQSTAASLFRLFPSAGNKIVVEFDYFAYGNLTGGGDGLALVFSDSSVVPQPGGYGGSLGYAQKDTVSGFDGGWMGIGLDEYGNFLNRNDGGKSGGFTTLVRDTITIRGSGAGTSGYNYITSNGQIPSNAILPSSLSPSISTATGHRYRVTIDHENGINAYVSVERDTGAGFATVVSRFDMLVQTDQDGMPGKLYLTLTGATGGAKNAHEIDNLEVCANAIESAYAIDHYELVRDRLQGLTCEALNITSKACLNDSCSSQVIGPVTTTFAPLAGWQSSNVKTNYASGDSFQFQHITAETITLGVTASLPALGPLSTFADTQCYVGLVKQSNCSVNFVDAAFRFFTTDDPLNSVPAYNLTTGLQLSNLLFRAIKTDEATGQCLAFLPNLSSVTSAIGTTCSNPSTCAVGQQVTWAQVSATPLNNPENNPGASNTSAVPVDFGTNGSAEFSLTAPDMGLQVLTVTSAEFPDIGGTNSGRTITGSVNLRVAPSSIEISNRETLSGSNLDPGLSTISTVMAGEDFRVSIQALDSAGDPVVSFSRYDTDLSTAGIQHFPVSWAHSNDFPAQGTLTGSGSSSSNAQSWLADGTKLSTLLKYSEVSQISLAAQISDLWADASPTSPSFVSPALEVGQFVAGYLSANLHTIATWGSGNAYQGESDDIVGLSFEIQAFPISGPIPIQPILNYDNSSPNFPNDGAARLQKQSSDMAIGGNLTSTLAWATDSQPDPLFVDDASVILWPTLTDIIWARRLSAPTIDDANDLSALRLISGFDLTALSFSDSSGACLKAVASDACPAANATRSFTTIDRPLFYLRLNIADQVDASDREAFIPLNLEYLKNVTDVTASAISGYEFQTLISEQSLTQADFTGLSNSGACTLSARDKSDTTSAAVLCTEIANSTQIPSSTFDDPFASGAQQMAAGQGLFRASSDQKVVGLVEVQANIPAWMSWYWDGDIDLSDSLDSLELSAPSSLVLFGEYQGRYPFLFVRPGSR